YPIFSRPLSHLFLVLIPPFPGPSPIFSRPLSQLFQALIPPFPAAEPRLDSVSCPGPQNWTEGQEGLLLCRARGRPRPQVECSKDGNSLAVGIPRPAARGHAGTYRCQASNALGTAERNVTVWVQCAWGAPGVLGILGV
ncbi:ICAM5 protein, partial [Tichodroma muraria]|nr:ICAM5 protein [Tichodroma muraria]